MCPLNNAFARILCFASIAPVDNEIAIGLVSDKKSNEMARHARDRERPRESQHDAMLAQRTVASYHSVPLSRTVS